MANSTSYRIEGKQEDLKTLNELINEFMDGTSCNGRQRFQGLGG